MATVGDVLSSALRLAGVLAAEESMSADQSENGIETLNELLAMWGTTRMTRAGNQQLTHTLTDETVTFGTGGDVATRIQGATSVIVRSGGLDYTLREISIDDYATIPLKSTGGTPDAYCLDNGYPLNTMRIYPVPSSGMQLRADAVVAMAEYSNVADTVNLPPETRKALREALAIHFCAEYGIEPSAALVAMSRQSQSAMRRAYRVPAARFDPALPNVSRFDVRTNQGAY